MPSTPLRSTDAEQRTEVGDVLAVPQRRDRHADRDPDERELERVVAHRAVADLEHLAAPRRRGDERERAADPERVRHPVEDRGDPAVEAAEGELHPLVRPALLREGASDLGHQEHVRGDEQQGEDDQPGEALRAVRGDRPEGVEADERADGEEHHVEPAQRLDELALLLQSELRRVLEV
jgi:hypothetical protein